MGRNLLFLIIGALIVVGAGYAYYSYQQEQKPTGIELQINKTGVSIDKN